MASSDFKVICGLCQKVCIKQVSYESNICYECSKIRDNLIYGWYIDVSLIYDNYVIEITYFISRRENEGYCSDSYESEIYPLLKIFKETDIHKNHIIDISNPKLAYYEQPGQGVHNGFYDRTITYKITKALVKNKTNSIELDK